MPRYKAQIDKTKITGFSLSDIDEEIANPQHLVIHSNEAANTIKTPSKNVYAVKIRRTDNLQPPFDVFTIQKGPKNYLITQLEITKNDPSTHNLYGFNFEEYLLRIEKCDDYLIENGILCDFENIRFKYLEINKTIPIDKDFEEYARIISLLVMSLNKKMKMSKIVQEMELNQTYYIGSYNNSMRLKFYDKQKELAELGFIADAKSLRIELTFKDEKSIIRYFGTSKISEFTEDLIQQVFEEFVSEKFINQFFEAKEERLKQASYILNKCYSTYSSHTWTRQALASFQDYENKNHTPLLLELSELYEALEQFYQDNNLAGTDNKNIKKRYNIRASFKKTVNELFPLFAIDEINKLNELFSKLQ